MGGNGNAWVFGYGSLMWNPGFPFLRAEKATVSGYHRQLCVYSFRYRGKPTAPGLVFGLDRGGTCTGLAFEVAQTDWPSTLDYLRRREQITMVYEEASVDVELTETSEKTCAITYVVDRTHPQCACGLAGEDILRLVRQGAGEAGSCLDYVLATHGKLKALGIEDKALDRIVAKLA